MITKALERNFESTYYGTIFSVTSLERTVVLL